MIDWQYYPKSKQIPNHLRETVDIFRNHVSKYNSQSHHLNSNEVLSILRNDLVKIGYQIEKGKKLEDKIRVPVLFGRGGVPEKTFDADGYWELKETVLEVEAGRAVINFQFLKDLFQACMMHNVNYLVIAVRKIYRNNPDFEKVTTFFDTLFSSGRLKLPLEGILIIGY